MTMTIPIQPASSSRTGELAARPVSTSVATKSVLRWGGLAGMLGASIAVPVAIVGLVFSPPPPAGPCGAPCYVDVVVANFPAEKVASSLGFAAYFAALVLFSFFFLALYQALRDGSLAPALFGSGAGVLGIVLMAAGGLPSVAFAHISDLYYAPGATPQDQATLGLVAHGVQAIFNETDTVGGIFLAVAFVLLGAAMLPNITFGKRLGGVTMALALIALVGIAVISIGQDNPNDYAFVILLAILPALLGWKLHSLSRR